MNKISIIFLSLIIFVNSIHAGDRILQTDLHAHIDIIVAWDCSGDYLTVEEGINAVPDKSQERTVLFIKNGTYREKLVIPSTKINLTMVGEHVDSASSNAELDSILIAGHPVDGFDTEVLNYTVPLPEGSMIYFPVDAFTSAPDTKTEVSRPTSFQGTVTIVATSVVGSSRTYSIEVFITTGLDVNNQTNTEVIFQNPFRDKLNCRIIGASSCPSHLLLFSPTGSLVLNVTLRSNVNGDHLFQLSGSGESGLYLYRLIFKNIALSGKLIRV